MKLNNTISNHIFICLNFTLMYLVSCGGVEIKKEDSIIKTPEESIDITAKKIIAIDSVSSTTISELIWLRFPSEAQQEIDTMQLIQSEVRYDFVLGKFTNEPISERDPKLFRLANDTSKIIVDFDGQKLILLKESGRDFLLYSYVPLDLKNEQNLASGIILSYKNALFLFSFESQSGMPGEGISSITQVDRNTLRSEKILVIHLNMLYFMFEGDEYQERTRCSDWTNCIPKQDDSAVNGYTHEVTINKLHELFLVPCDSEGKNSTGILTNSNPESTAPTWIYKRLGEIILDGKPLIWY